MYKTPSGGILCMKNGCALVVQGNRVRVLDSIEDYHTKFKGPKDRIETWTELTTDIDKEAFLKENGTALHKLNWKKIDDREETIRRLEKKANSEAVIKGIIFWVAWILFKFILRSLLPLPK